MNLFPPRILKLDLSALEKRKDRGNRIIARCPACAESGGDVSGEHLVIFPDGRFACAAHAGDHLHRQLIWEMIGQVERPAFDRSLVVRSRTVRTRINLLERIIAKFPSEVVDLWEGSPIRCDEDLDDSKAFLRIFPADAVLWIAPDVYQSGKPEHAPHFRTREQWQAETFTAPGMRIAPCSFKPGTYSRTRENTAEHLFVVVESDEIGEGKLYRNKDEFCSLIRWLREACDWHLSAVVDSGGKSLHAWFRHPGVTDLEKLAKYASALGLDQKLGEPAQPWRLPGVGREGSERRQCLIFLENIL